MSPGTWAELTGTNTGAVLSDHGLSDFNSLPYANSGAWSRNRLKAYFTGADHGNNGLWHYVFDAASNSWTDLGAAQNTSGGSHGYDHIVIDSVTDNLYFSPAGYAPLYTSTGGIPWTQLTAWTNTQYVQVSTGATWWAGTLTGATNGAVVVYNSGAFSDGGSSADGQIIIYDPNQTAWIADGDDIVGFVPNGGNGTYHAIAEYSPVHNCAIVGGGSATFYANKVFRLNSDWSVTQLTDCPLASGFGIQRANVTLDPVTENFLFLGGGEFWELDPRGSGTWTDYTATRLPPYPQVGDPGPGTIDDMISFPVSNYGVVAYVTMQTSTGYFYLYKHAASTPAATPLGLFLR